MKNSSDWKGVLLRTIPIVVTAGVVLKESSASKVLFLYRVEIYNSTRYLWANSNSKLVVKKSLLRQEIIGTRPSKLVRTFKLGNTLKIKLTCIASHWVTFLWISLENKKRQVVWLRFMLMYCFFSHPKDLFRLKKPCCWPILFT